MCYFPALNLPSAYPSIYLADLYIIYLGHPGKRLRDVDAKVLLQNVEESVKEKW
jgi:hypothetical protein